MFLPKNASLKLFLGPLLQFRSLWLGPQGLKSGSVRSSWLSGSKLASSCSGSFGRNKAKVYPIAYKYCFHEDLSSALAMEISRNFQIQFGN